jgi:hypothetical protein
MRGGRLPTLIAALALATGLVACGDDGDDGGDQPSGDEAQIADVIETTSTSTDPAHCTDLETQRFVEQTTSEQGEDALVECQEDDEENNADSVEITNVKVDGTTATADVAFTGSALDGQVVNLSLVKEGEQWKLDYVERFVEFDRQAYIGAIRELLLASDDPPVDEEQADCVVAALDEQDDATLQELFLSGDDAQLTELITPCFQQG